jgi:hypothetical protein
MTEICSQCHVGSPKQQTGTWARLIGPHLIVLPGIMTAVCDVCGWVEYDPIIVRQLEALLLSGNLPSAMVVPHPTLQPEESEWLKKWAVNTA